MEYRNELKFILSRMELEQIRWRLQELMSPDSHQTGDGYTVRSLYFDDLFDSCLEEVLSGVDNRRKFRIRLYNGSTDVIHLEKKSKLRSMTRKVSETVDADMCLAYLAGHPVPGREDLSQELFLAGLRSGMQPKCIVEYERFAFVEPVGNVRITFDTNIRGTMDTGQFLDPQCRDCTPVLPEGMHILEVKFDEFLPEYILQAVDLNHMRRTSFSKYANVRTATNSKEVIL